MIGDKSERIPDYIEHIISAIYQIEKYSFGLDFAAFAENKAAATRLLMELLPP